MDISFDLIKKTRYFKIALITLSVCIGFAFAVSFFRENYGYEPDIVLIIVFMSVLTIVLLTYFFKGLKYKTYGKLILSEQDLTVDDTFYSLSYINEIKIEVDGYDGQMTWHRSKNSDTNFTKDGADNYLTIITEDHKTVKVRFFIEFLYEIDSIKMIVEKWKKHHKHLIIDDTYNK